MIDVLIVDDEPLARERLARMVEKTSDYHAVSEVGTTQAAMEAIHLHDPGVVLLDIQMPGEDGLSAAKKIAALDNPPAIIFCTAFSDYALDAFHTIAVDYLLKPVKQGQLEDALLKVSALNKVQRAALDPAKNTSERSHITAKTHRGLELISLQDVRIFVADQKYVTVYHTKGENLLDVTLKELEEEFSERLVRVHRNALVSIDHIQGLDRSTEGIFSIRLADTNETPLVSRRHAAHVKTLLRHL